MPGTETCIPPLFLNLFSTNEKTEGGRTMRSPIVGESGCGKVLARRTLCDGDSVWFSGGKRSFSDCGVVMSFVAASFILPLTAQREMFVAFLWYNCENLRITIIILSYMRFLAVNLTSLTFLLPVYDHFFYFLRLKYFSFWRSISFSSE